MQMTDHTPHAQLRQWVKRTVWMDGCDVETEYRQAREEGRDLSFVEADFIRLISIADRSEDWFQQAGDLVDLVQNLPLNNEYSYTEPSDLEGIHKERPAGISLPTFDPESWYDRLHGGLLGRICGCMLGKPIEAWTLPNIKALGKVTGNWPIVDYFRMPTASENLELDTAGVNQRFPDTHACMLRDTMDGMVEDDDINYTLIGFAIVREYGKEFTPLDVAYCWCGNVPILHTCTAERAAYRNFVGNVLPPQSAVKRNPYREWIGAQIRADYFGYANPRNPERAAEWAWRDASISHVKNGIYGEMWVAAMLAAAHVVKDWLEIIHIGLAQIPSNCRLREDIDKILALHVSGASYEKAVSAVHDQWNETVSHDWCHTNSNAQIVAIGLLYGEDDFEKTITRAVMAALDTDCNGATCGSLWGVKHGASAIPAKWTAPINDKVRSGVAGYYEVAISKLAADMLVSAQQNV